MSGIKGDRIRVFGLGLGYLADALGERLVGVEAIAGERERLHGIPDRTEAFDRLAERITEHCTRTSLERAVVLAFRRGETVIVDPSLNAAPALAAPLTAVLTMLSSGIRATIIHLRTAGDVLRCLSAAQVFKRQNPSWSIEFVTEHPYGEIASMARGLDHVHEIERSTESLAHLPRPLIAFNLGGDHRSARLASTLDPVLHVGYREDSSGGIVLGDDRDEAHAAALAKIRNNMNRYHLAYAILGLKPASDPPDLGLQYGGGSYGVIQFGAGSGAQVWEPKRVPPASLSAAMRAIGGRWISVGGPEERAIAAAAGIPDHDNLCGATSWSDLAALLTKARFYIGHDSGPTHLAAALGVPTVALFGFTSPILNAPIGPRTLVIQRDMPCAFAGCPIPCPERTCTTDFPPDAILAACRLLEAESTGAKLDAAADLRSLGMRYWTGGISVETVDPLFHLIESEPRIGAPCDPAASLAREWLEKAERY